MIARTVLLTLILIGEVVCCYLHAWNRTGWQFTWLGLGSDSDARRWKHTWRLPKMPPNHRMIVRSERRCRSLSPTITPEMMILLSPHPLFFPI